MKVKLSERLSAVAAFVAEGNRLCDVGCDHAFLPIALVQAGRIPSAIAMDVRKGPLAIAAGNIAEAGLESRIETRLSDGLEALQAQEADSVVLAGMGGQLMLDILAKGIDAARTAKEWVLQPQSDVRRVRQWLRMSGFAIADEEMVCERGKFYPVLRVMAGAGGQGTPPGNSGRTDFCDPANESFATLDRGILQNDADALADMFGAVLLKKKHPVLREFLEKEDRRISRILDGLADAEGGRRAELDEERRLVRLGLKKAGRNESTGCAGCDQ